MKRVNPPRHRALCVAILALAPLLAAGQTDPLADGFRAPPPDARPHTWWHWMNGNVSKEGITADLEAMQRIGVGGAQIFNVAQGELLGPVKFLSPEWTELTKHAMAEAARLGLEMTMHNCAGWSESGGPWITPELAMQQVVWSDTRVHGGRKISIALPQPKTVVGYYEDIAVLALPALTAERESIATLAPKVTTSVAGLDAQPLLAGELAKAIELPAPTAAKPQFVQVEFHAPQTLGSIRFTTRDQNSLPLTGLVEVSDDGISFRKIADFPPVAKGRNHPSYLAPFPETTARVFRFTVTKIDARAKTLALMGVELGGARLLHSESQAGFRPDAEFKFSATEAAPGEAIAADRVIDLTEKFKDGKLEWDAPAGDWTIVRFGHTPTGQQNAPAPDTGRGLECDKMNRAAVELHFEAVMGRVIREVGPLAGKSFKYVLADSWEAGCQNWTPAMRAEFQKRRGYDLLPWLPTLAGRVVASTEQSERFLWDFRQTISELIVENHFGVFQELCRKHGMLFTSEAPGIGMPTIADELASKGRTDVPMGEFWMDGHNDSKETAVAAHIYGTKIAAAEAFTANTEDAKWMKSPFDHKMLGDLHYTLGINRFVFHRFAHQPWLDRLPGMTMGRWGTNFDRTNTWWEQARAWMSYLARCQYLLQRGNFVGDICYFYGDGAPNTLTKREPAIPAGYDYDAINAEVLLTRMSVKDGRLVLPDGTSYRVMLLADSDRMTPAVAKKISEFVAAGATIVGRRPEKSPSLSGFPGCDAEVKQIAAAMWGDVNGTTITEHAFGRGRVFWGKPIGDVLTSIGTAADFAAGEGSGKFAYIHRRIGDAEVYFVSSQNAAATAATLTFRVGGKVPELWRPDTGEIEQPAAFSERDGRTSVPLHFDPAGSVFVIFRAPSAGVDPVAAMTRAGDPAGADVRRSGGSDVSLVASESGEYRVRTNSGRELQANVTVPATIELSGSWEVRFPPNWGAPASVGFPSLVSWTVNDDEAIKHFSGTATYVKEFEAPANLFGDGRSVTLDLGRVKEVAEVKVNGRDLGVLWKPPFCVDISSALRPGKNQIEVRITNLWPNRLIGDLALPEAQRRTWTTFQPFKADSPLLESGLLGPVRLRPSVTAAIAVK